MACLLMGFEGAAGQRIGLLPVRRAHGASLVSLGAADAQRMFTIVYVVMPVAGSISCTRMQVLIHEVMATWMPAPFTMLSGGTLQHAGRGSGVCQLVYPWCHAGTWC